MQLPPASAASPRPAGPGPVPAPQPGVAAGFEAVMSGILAADSKTPDGIPQQGPDGGAQGKPAADGPGTAARAAKPEAPKAAKDTVDAAGPTDPTGAAGVAGLAAGVAAVAADAGAASVLAAGAVRGTAALQASGPVVAVPDQDGAVVGAVAAKTIADTSAAVRLVVGVPGGRTQAAPAGTGMGAPPVAPAPVAAAPVAAAPKVKAAPPPGLSGQIPGRPSSVGAGTLPAERPPTNPLLPAGPEAGISATAAQTGESSTAVVLPVGTSATPQGPQRDPARILGEGTQAAAAPGIPAGFQAGAPVVVHPAPTLQGVPSPAAPGTATPALDAGPAKLLPQVSGPLFSLASAAPGSHVMTVKLSPEDLGPLTVRAHIEGAAVRIELFAPGEAGREAVRSILPELRRGLGESGFGASLDLSEHNAPADAWAGGSDPRGSGAQDRRPAESPAFPRGSDGEPVRLPRTAVIVPRSSTSSLDILV